MNIKCDSDEARRWIKDRSVKYTQDLQEEKTLRDREVDDLKANVTDLVEKRRVKLEEFEAERASLLASHEEEIAKLNAEVSAAAAVTGVASPAVIAAPSAKPTASAAPSRYASGAGTASA